LTLLPSTKCNQPNCGFKSGELVLFVGQWWVVLHVVNEGGTTTTDKVKKFNNVIAHWTRKKKKFGSAGICILCCRGAMAFYPLWTIIISYLYVCSYQYIVINYNGYSNTKIETNMNNVHTTPRQMDAINLYHTAMELIYHQVWSMSLLHREQGKVIVLLLLPATISTRVSIHLLRPSNDICVMTVETGVPMDIGRWSEQMYGHRFFVILELVVHRLLSPLFCKDSRPSLASNTF
jgi:hypothetical protein